MAEFDALSDGFSAILKKSQEVSEPAYQKIQAAEEDYAKTKGELGVKAAELKAKSARGSAGGQLAVYDKYEKELMAPAPTIQYSADTADGMKNLAMLLPIAGMMMGGSGQLSGVGALKAMSGVLEGHKQGNQDRIALEQKNFEQQMQNWKIHQEQIKGAFERALQRAKINASAAQSGLQVDLAKLDAQLLLADVKKNGIIDPLKRFNAMNEKVTTAIEGAVVKMYSEKPENFTVNGQTRLMLPSEAVAMEKAGATVVKSGTIRTATIKDPAQLEMVTKALGVNLGTDAPAAAQISASMAEAASLAKYVKENPNVMGRSGQMQGFIDRYISSFNSGDTSQIDAEANKADTETQKALLFAKRYAKFLTDYERAVAGGARGFTVNLQQRYNQLMSSGQFNPDSFIQLMREHSKEIASGATQLGEGITYDKLMDLGGTIRSNAGDNTVNDAISFLKGGKSTAPAAPSAPTTKKTIPPADEVNIINSITNEAMKKPLQERAKVMEDFIKSIESNGYDTSSIKKQLGMQ
jgi:hypothetical protein